MVSVTKSLAGTHEVAKNFLEHLAGREGQATVVCLYGNLGAGKTSFTQGLAVALEIPGNIISPTFVIEKIYKIGKKCFFKNLIHIDAYRLNSGAELLKIGWNDVLSDQKNLIVLEWPERVVEVLPKDCKKIYLEFVDEDTRKIEFKDEK
ncbi:MAG: tRNA (adenosine(37)-N6)-threonylcarbamoyltransferase complex ATPase subunit type 1 TsaE [Candidatus Paceibacterota bacterium]|jgi:tRNA threonylcarbamoyladenosine biosynthesis protein TsaE